VSRRRTENSFGNFASGKALLSTSGVFCMGF
jgi:hypothetical protein